MAAQHAAILENETDQLAAALALRASATLRGR